MSLTAREYHQKRKSESQFYHRLVSIRSLDTKTLEWMTENGKDYSLETRVKFNLQQGVLQRFDKKAGSGSRGFVCADPCIIIPVGSIYRCYKFLQPKAERWGVVPTGHGAQWLGDLPPPEPILCEGEWDFLCLQDHGFTNAMTHTAGAGTWHPEWTALFKDKVVRLCYDRDAKGQQGAAKAAARLFAVAKEVRLVDLPLPGTPETNDISDYFKLGGTVDEFRKLLERARLFTPRFYRGRGRGNLRSKRLHSVGS